MVKLLQKQDASIKINSSLHLTSWYYIYNVDTKYTQEVVLAIWSSNYLVNVRYLQEKGH